MAKAQVTICAHNVNALTPVIGAVVPATAGNRPKHRTRLPPG